MFKNLRLQFAAYKWIIVISLFAALTITAGWQYHRATVLANDAVELKKENESLSGKIEAVNKLVVEVQQNTTKAMADLQALREDYAKINAKTAELQGNINDLRKKPVAPNGANAPELEAEANSLIKQVFDRMESASRGNTK